MNATALAARPIMYPLHDGDEYTGKAITPYDISHFSEDRQLSRGVAIAAYREESNTTVLLRAYVSEEGQNDILLHPTQEITYFSNPLFLRDEDAVFDRTLDVYENLTWFFHVSLNTADTRAGSYEESDTNSRRDYIRCANRLRELENLQNGWYNGAGRKPTSRAVFSARKFLTEYYYMASHFRIFPTEVGGITFEFKRIKWSYVVEFNSRGRVMFYGVEVDGDNEIKAAKFSDMNEEFLGRLNDHLDVKV